MPVTGGKVDATDVVGRDGVVAELRDLLRSGNNVLIVDPRRMGKTTVVDVLCAQPGPDALAVKIDLEGTESIGEALALLIRAVQQHQSLWTRAKATIGRYVDLDASIGPIKLKPAVASKPVAEVLSDVVAAIDHHLGKEILIIAIDELPMALEGMSRHGSAHEASQLLHRLRQLRQSTKSIRWVHAGSIGFHHVLHDLGDTEGVIGDLTTISPGPLDAGSARLLAGCLLLGIRRESDDQVADEFASITGGIPFIMHHVAHLLKAGSGPVTVDEVRRSFDHFARDRDTSRALTHMLSRLGGDRRLMRVLDAVALYGPLNVDELWSHVNDAIDVSDRHELNSLIDSLCDDHYLRREPDRIHWKYDVLRRVWMIRQNLP